MEFKIVETYRNHYVVDFLKQLIANIFLFIFSMIVITTVLIANLFKKKNRNLNKEDISEKSKWFEFIKTDKITLHRKFIDENDLPNDLDLPKEYSDVYAFEIKSESKFIEFENVIFNFSELETEKGIYLISLNKIGNNMSLWNINKMNNEIQIVTKLKSIWWEISKVANKIILKGTEYKKEYKLEIEEN
jgi:hypothetical protein